MSTASTVEEVSHADEENLYTPHMARNGMVIFLASEFMLFAGLIVAYVILRAGVAEWPPAGAPVFGIDFSNIKPLQGLMIFNTILLISSSFTYHWAESSIKKGGTGTGWLAVSALLGLIFLSLQAFEWAHLAGVAHLPASLGGDEHHAAMWIGTHGIYSACFFLLTGFHGLHVAIGVVFIIIAVYRSITIHLKRVALGEESEDEVFVECVGLYWHFVDVVWILLFFVLYIF